MQEQPYLVVGLGNPGPEYNGTRHNIGFQAVDSFARLHGAAIERMKLQGLVGTVRVDEKRVLLLKPQTYMNRSGSCVRGVVDYYRIPLEQVVVIHDDLDLAVGRIKVMARGGAGGHNGIRSIIRHLGSRDFSRIRIGIGRPQGEHQFMPIERYVLSPFSAQEQEIMHEKMALVIQAIELFLEHGVVYCMNRINGLR